MKEQGKTLGGRCGTTLARGRTSTRWEGATLPKLWAMQPLFGPRTMHPRGEGPQSGGMKWWWWRRRRVSPPPLSVKPPPPPAIKGGQGGGPAPPPSDLHVGALAATLATHLTDTCKTLVEQAAVMHGGGGRIGQGGPTAGRPCPG